MVPSQGTPSNYFYYFGDQCQEGKKPTVEGHVFDKMNLLIESQRSPLIALNHGLG